MTGETWDEVNIEVDSKDRNELMYIGVNSYWADEFEAPPPAHFLDHGARLLLSPPHFWSRGHLRMAVMHLSI